MLEETQTYLALGNGSEETDCLNFTDFWSKLPLAVQLIRNRFSIGLFASLWTGLSPQHSLRCLPSSPVTRCWRANPAFYILETYRFLCISVSMHLQYLLR